MGGTPVLDVDAIEVVYDNTALVLRGVSLEVPEGGIVALLGANGAGKSTTLKAVSNLLAADGGRVRNGSIRFRGEPVQGADAAELVRRGIVQVMEGRHVFENLTVDDNLRAGAFARWNGRTLGRELSEIYDLFPRLAERRRVKAGFLSGGEQQMLAIGRALMARPSLLLLDEPSMGLAPLVVEEIFAIVRRLNREAGVSILLAEQNAAIALSTVHYGYVMESGCIALEGTADDLRGNDGVKEFYLGLTSLGERKSYRELKQYRRRTRWA